MIPPVEENFFKIPNHDNNYIMTVISLPIPEFLPQYISAHGMREAHAMLYEGWAYLPLGSYMSLCELCYCNNIWLNSWC